jgi:hypothetical protein
MPRQYNAVAQFEDELYSAFRTNFCNYSSASSGRNFCSLKAHFALMYPSQRARNKRLDVKKHASGVVIFRWKAGREGVPRHLPK